MQNTTLRFLTEPEQHVLSHITKNGPSYGLAIQRRIRIYSDKTVYVTLGSLANKGLLEITKANVLHKKRPSRGRPVNKWYSLTLTGFCYAMTSEENLWKSFDKIITIWGCLLPFLAKRWGIFEKSNSDVLFIENLRHSMEDHTLMAHRRRINGYSLSVYTESIVFDFFFHLLEENFRPPIFGGTVFYRLNEIFRRDDEFKEKLVECSRILWLDSKWRTTLYEERHNLFEKAPSRDPWDYLENYPVESKKLAIDESRKRVERALQDWGVSEFTFSELIAIHAIRRIESGRIAYEFTDII